MRDSDAVDGCDGCGITGLAFSAAWHEAFGLVLCSACRSKERLISKATAKAAYLLTETDLKRLGSISQPNPHNSRWKPMKLFLERQCEDMAMQKHGSIEELEELIESRREKKLDLIMKKRSREREEGEGEGEGEDEEGDNNGEEKEEGRVTMTAAQRQLRDKLRGDYSVSAGRDGNITPAGYCNDGLEVEEI